MGIQQENLDRQRELYGEPLADVAARITGAFGLTQSRLAETLGMSAPMLSQLLSGHRVKIGNPAVLGRLRALADLVDEAPGWTPTERDARLASIHETSPTLTTARSDRASEAAAGLRAAAPASELERLAALTTAPELAALLREAAHRDG